MRSQGHCGSDQRLHARGAKPQKLTRVDFSRNVKRFRGGLVFKAHRLLYLSTLGLRVIKKKDPGYTRSRSGFHDFEFLTECRKSLAPPLLHGPGLISANVIRNCVLRNEIYYTNALLLLVWPHRVVIFDAQT